MWGSYSWLKQTLEQDNSGNPTYGVFSAKVSPVENTDFCWHRLDQNNAFTPRAVPVRYMIRSADGGNEVVQVGSARYGIGGRQTALFYPDRAGFVLDAAFKLLAGPPKDLNSYSLEFYDTQQTLRFLGGKVASLTIRGSAQDQLMRLDVDWVFQQQASSPPSLAAPSPTNFSATNPYTFQETAGVVKRKNTVLTSYKDIVFSVQNVLDPTFDELGFITNLYYCGRNITWGVNAQYASTTPRADFFSVAVQATNQIKWAKGGNSVTFDLKSSNYITNVQDDLPLGGASYQQQGQTVLFDRTAAVSLSYTVV